MHYRLVSSFQKINIGNTGNQNHPDSVVSVVLVTCIFNIDFFLSWKRADNAKMLNTFQGGGDSILAKWNYSGGQIVLEDETESLLENGGLPFRP